MHGVVCGVGEAADCGESMLVQINVHFTDFTSNVSNVQSLHTLYLLHFDTCLPLLYSLFREQKKSFNEKSFQTNETAVSMQIVT